MRSEHLRPGQIVAVHFAAIAAEVNDHAPIVTIGRVTGYDDTHDRWWVQIETPAGSMDQMYRPGEILGLWWASL